MLSEQQRKVLSKAIATGTLPEGVLWLEFLSGCILALAEAKAEGPEMSPTWGETCPHGWMPRLYSSEEYRWVRSPKEGGKDSRMFSIGEYLPCGCLLTAEGPVRQKYVTLPLTDDEVRQWARETTGDLPLKNFVPFHAIESLAVGVYHRIMEAKQRVQPD